jgi:hypothetical protein
MVKPKKDKKPKKPRAKKQTQKGQSQTQIVNITLPRARRGRPAKKSMPSGVGQIGLPQTIIRMNEPPLPLPFQPPQLAIEPLKSVGDFSALNQRLTNTEQNLAGITDVARDFIQRQQQTTVDIKELKKRGRPALSETVKKQRAEMRKVKAKQEREALKQREKEILQQMP